MQESKITYNVYWHDRKQKMIRLSTCQTISGQQESCILDIFKLLLLQPCGIPFRQRNLPQSSCNKITARLLGWVSCWRMSKMCPQHSKEICIPRKKV